MTEDIRRAEHRVGRPLPPSYRAFLRRYDGWPRFFHGASLLGTRDLGKSSYADLAQAAFEAAETPVPELGPPSSRVVGYPSRVIPFGIDADATTLFAFDSRRVRQDGEMEVIAWINEIGIRSADFCEFLVMIAELCEADLESLESTSWSKSA